MIIHDGLTRIARDYLAARSQDIAGHPLAVFIRREFPQAVETLLPTLADPSNVIIQGATFPGNWAMIPWLGIMDRRLTETIQNGIYVVYLFSEDMRRVFLTIAMGVTDMPIATRDTWLGEVQASFTSPAGFELGPLQPGEIGARGMAPRYEKCVIFYKRYDTADLPIESELQRDLSSILGTLGEIAASGRFRVSPQVTERDDVVSWRGLSFTSSDVVAAFAATSEDEWRSKPGIKPRWCVRLNTEAKPLKAVFRHLPGVGPNAAFTKDEAARVFTKLQFSIFDSSVARAPQELSLLGTWRNVDAADVEAINTAIKERGGWASWWSFPIREEYHRVLEGPFDLYLNAGSGRFPARLRVERFVTSRGNNGIGSPWPEITDQERLGATREGPSNAQVYKTWLFVTAAEVLEPPLTLAAFEPADEAPANSLLNQSSFGYVFLRSDRTDADVQPPRNLIVYGPPGTGKTYWLQQQLKKYMDHTLEEDGSTTLKKRYRIVTFHPSMTYEDFIAGIRPVSNDAGVTSFAHTDGIFKEICDEARADPSERYALFIDEINRANIAKVFGELISLIEVDKRAAFDADGEVIRGLAVQLPGGGHRSAKPALFGVPENLDIYGTMNTADRSIALLDIALRRRFDFEEMGPDYQLLDRSIEGVRLDALLRVINDRLEYLLDRDHRIGHAYLIKLQTLDDLKLTFRNKIIPLLQEYFFDDLARVAMVLESTAGSPLVRTENLRREALFRHTSARLVGEDRRRYNLTALETWTAETFAGIYQLPVKEPDE